MSRNYADALGDETARKLTEFEKNPANIALLEKFFEETKETLQKFRA